jgi:hypothetical protein
MKASYYVDLYYIYEFAEDFGHWTFWTGWHLIASGFAEIAWHTKCSSPRSSQNTLEF